MNWMFWKKEEEELEIVPGLLLVEDLIDSTSLDEIKGLDDLEEALIESEKRYSNLGQNCLTELCAVRQLLTMIDKKKEEK